MQMAQETRREDSSLRETSPGIAPQDEIADGDPLKRRYQVFVSSTFSDLTEERKHVMQALLATKCIPSGMELFPAASTEQLCRSQVYSSVREPPRLCRSPCMVLFWRKAHRPPQNG
jgi:hypothetical protein